MINKSFGDVMGAWRRRLSWFGIAAVLIAAISGGEAPAPPGVLGVPLAEAAARFRLPPGYRIELVASEPMIVNPVTLGWDGDGRMYVAEMRTYMPDASGRGQEQPTSCVSRLIDRDGDGVSDAATRFVDGLVLPRMVLPLDDRVIIAESFNGRLVSHRDRDGDGIADERNVLYEGSGNRANIQLQDSGLLWAIDNHLYTAQLAARRFRLVDGVLTALPMAGARNGQWGLAMDDCGRLFASSAGGQLGASGFQQHPIYGGLALSGERGPGFNEVFPGVQLSDTEGGAGSIHPQRRTLRSWASCGGQCVFRGDRLPADAVGDYFVTEPVGRFVRRATITVVAGKRVLINAHPGDEFLTTTDLCFRPVWTATGPDGCLYIVDMHKGVIEEKAFIHAGSLLEKEIQRLGLASHNDCGRIWRVVHQAHTPGPSPRMLAQTAAELVAHLSHPNGWWRDTAQKLLVLRRDRSVIPALTTLARSGPAALGRLHALWTLDGLDATSRELLVAALGDRDARVRAAAIRIGEGLLASGDDSFLARLAPLGRDPDMDVVVQLALSLRYSASDKAKQLLNAIASAYAGNEIAAASAQQSLRPAGAPARGDDAGVDGATLALARRGQAHFTQYCANCHGGDGKGLIGGDDQRVAPSLAGSPRALGDADVAVRILLHGLAGEIDGRTYPGLMVPLHGNEDAWLAEVLAYVRTSFGNRAPAIPLSEIARVRAAAGERDQPWTLSELRPWQPVARAAGWSATASHASDDAARTIDGDAGTRWDVGTPPAPGQWLQLDLGRVHRLTRLRLDAGSGKSIPPRCELRTSLDGQTWSAALATATGGVLTDLHLTVAADARFVRIVLTADAAPRRDPWAVVEATVFGVAR